MRSSRGLGKKPKHGKRPKKTSNLAPVSATIKAGGTVTLTVKLGSSAISGLKIGAKESIVFSLTATNSNGSGKAGATISRVRSKSSRRRNEVKSARRGRPGNTAASIQVSRTGPPLEHPSSRLYSP